MLRKIKYGSLKVKYMRVIYNFVLSYLKIYIRNFVYLQIYNNNNKFFKKLNYLKIHLNQIYNILKF